MALQTFTWNNGTNDNPVSLTAQQLANLVKLTSKENIAKDVKGHITTSSGTISRYDKYVLNQAFPNLIVHATDIEDSFSLVAAKSTINEGESTVIAVIGLAIAAVDFELEHTITGRSGIEESAVRSKIRMEGNYLVVDAPQENASWRDVVRVKAKPIYEEWSNSSIVRYVDVTVVATAISGITLLGVNKIGCGNTAEISIGITPATSTKLSGLSFVNTLTSDGSLPVMQPTTSNGKIYVTAPAEECGLVLTTNAYLFGNTSSVAFFATKSFEVLFPHIRFVVTTDGTFSDISTANPRITLQKVDSEDTPIGEPVVLTGTVSGSSLIYTYGGGFVAGDGSETYKVSIENVSGYITPNIADIVPNGVITEVSTSYNAIHPDVYIVYSDKSIEIYDIVLQRGSIQQGKTPIGVRILTALTDFVISFDNQFEPTEIDNDGQSRHAIADYNNIVTLPKVPWSWGDVTVLDDDAVVAVNNEYYFTNVSIERDTPNNIFFKARNKTISIGNINYSGYIGGKPQMDAMFDNIGKISTLFTLSNKQMFDVTEKTFVCYQHAQYARSYVVYKKNDATPNREGDQRTVNNIKYVIYTDKNYIVVPIYFIDF